MRASAGTGCWRVLLLVAERLPSTEVRSLHLGANSPWVILRALWGQRPRRAHSRAASTTWRQGKVGLCKGPARVAHPQWCMHAHICPGRGVAAQLARPAHCRSVARRERRRTRPCQTVDEAAAGVALRRAGRDPAWRLAAASDASISSTSLGTTPNYHYRCRPMRGGGRPRGCPRRRLQRQRRQALSRQGSRVTPP
jgi:hypothetical protein